MPAPDADGSEQPELTDPPTFGIEEEFLLGEVGGIGLCEDAEAIRARALELTDDGVDHELRAAMIEIGTAVCRTRANAEQELTHRRRVLRDAAAEHGARVLATATHPVAVPAAVGYIGEDRYERLAELYGPVADDALVCGCHIHVQVADRATGVAVLNHIRGWLAPLIALSANSPLWQGRDTTYDSWRSRVWSTFPTAGPTSIFRNPDDYERQADSLVASGAALDRGMLYYDARLSERWPTVEVRVADVCLDAEDTLVVGLLVRALVMTGRAAGDRPAPETPLEVLRAAGFTASRHGVRGRLVDPVEWRLEPAATVLMRLLRHVSGALEQTGDQEYVAAGIDRILRRGTGASRQRHAWERRGPGGVLDLVALT